MKTLTKDAAMMEVQTAMTKEQLTAIFENCTKSVIAEVVKELTGEPVCEKKIDGAKKDYVVSQAAEKISRKLIAERQQQDKKEFQALSFDEKLEKIMNADENEICDCHFCKWVWLQICELEEIARLFSIDVHPCKVEAGASLTIYKMELRWKLQDNLSKMRKIYKLIREGAKKLCVSMETPETTTGTTKATVSIEVQAKEEAELKQPQAPALPPIEPEICEAKNNRTAEFEIGQTYYTRDGVCFTAIKINRENPMKGDFITFRDEKTGKSRRYKIRYMTCEGCYGNISSYEYVEGHFLPGEFDDITAYDTEKPSEYERWPEVAQIDIEATEITQEAHAAIDVEDRKISDAPALPAPQPEPEQEVEVQAKEDGEISEECPKEEKSLRQKVMEKYSDFVRAGQFDEAWLLLRLLRKGELHLGFSDEANTVEIFLTNIGCKVCYSRNYNMARVYLPKKDKDVRPVIEVPNEDASAIINEAEKMNELSHLMDELKAMRPKVRAGIF